jgi:hypothetical protein
MSLLDEVVDALERTTAAEPLHEKLVRWDWVFPNGDPAPWQHWCRGTAIVKNTWRRADG